MTLIQLLEKNNHHKGSTVFIGCSNFDAADVVYTYMQSGTLSKRDIHFFLHSNADRWQRWYDMHISSQNDFGVKSTFNKSKEIRDSISTISDDIGVAIIEDANPRKALELFSLIENKIRTSAIIVFPYSVVSTDKFKTVLESKYNSIELGHSINFSYLNYTKGKKQLGGSKPIKRSKSILT